MGLHRPDTEVGIVKNPFHRTVIIILKAILRGHKWQRIERKESDEDSLSRDRALWTNIWATNRCAPTENASVEDNPGSRILGPTAQRQRR